MATQGTPHQCVWVFGGPCFVLVEPRQRAPAPRLPRASNFGPWGGPGQRPKAAEGGEVCFVLMKGAGPTWTDVPCCRRRQ